MRNWILAMACLPCLGQLPELVKVTGKPNTLEVYDLKYYEPPKILTKNISITGKVWNAGNDGVRDLYMKCVVTLKHGQTLEAVVGIPVALEPGFETEFYASPIGLFDKSNVASVAFKATSFTLQSEHDRRAREVVTRCRNAKSTLGNKPIGSLTTNESDLINACKIARLW